MDFFSRHLRANRDGVFIMLVLQGGLFQIGRAHV